MAVAGWNRGELYCKPKSTMACSEEKNKKKEKEEEEAEVVCD